MHKFKGSDKKWEKNEDGKVEKIFWYKVLIYVVSLDGFLTMGWCKTVLQRGVDPFSTF